MTFEEFKAAQPEIQSELEQTILKVLQEMDEEVRGIEWFSSKAEEHNGQVKGIGIPG